MNRQILSLAAGAIFVFSPIGLRAQLTLNGENTFTDETLTWSDGFNLAFGDGEDGTLNLVNTSVNVGTSANTLANSDGASTVNTALLNIDSDSSMNISSGGATQIGLDGNATININGGRLDTRQARLGDSPGSSGVVNVDGSGALWTHRSWYVYVGIEGTGEVNVTNGGSISGAQRFVIGGTRSDSGAAGGTGTLTVDGPGSSVSFASSSLAFFGIGRRGTGTVTISNEAVIDAWHADQGIRVFVGNSEGGDGTLIIESGGVLNTNDVFRVNSGASDRGHVTITGENSQLNVTTTGISFVGNTGLTDGAEGIMDILEGGVANFDASVRIGNQDGAVGEVNVEGTGSELNLGTWFQVGASGTGTLNVRDGGRVEVDETSTSFSSVGRFSGGEGHLNIEGAGSEVIAPNELFLASGPSLVPTGGSGTITVADGGSLQVGGVFAVRGGSTVTLNEGNITAGGGTDLGGTDTLLTGEGTLIGNLVLSEDAAIMGTGSGIDVNGFLSGTGDASNATFTGLNALASIGGGLTLENVQFADGGQINLVIDDLSSADNMVLFDENTDDYSEVHLIVSFDGVNPDESWSAQVMQFTGPGEASYDFASVTTPDGWVFNDGILAIPEPSTYALILGLGLLAFAGYRRRVRR